MHREISSWGSPAGVLPATFHRAQAIAAVVLKAARGEATLDELKRAVDLAAEDFRETDARQKKSILRRQQYSIL